jgi:hypothetical protein
MNKVQHVYQQYKDNLNKVGFKNNSFGVSKAFKHEDFGGFPNILTQK